MDPSVHDPRTFAQQRHADQQWGDQPYTVHLDIVAMEAEFAAELLGPLLSAQEAKLLKTAAYLHDVLEDTDTTLEELVERFGEDVAQLVFSVSDEPAPTRSERKILTYPKIRSNRLAVLLKLCDRIVNVMHSKRFPSKLETYKREQQAFEAALYRSTDGFEVIWKRLRESFPA